MSLKPRKLGRTAVAIGGFLIMIGIVMISMLTLIFFDFLDAEAFLNSSYLMLFMTALLIVGVLDLVSAIILLRR